MRKDEGCFRRMKEECRVNHLRQSRRLETMNRSKRICLGAAQSGGALRLSRGSDPLHNAGSIRPSRCACWPSCLHPQRGACCYTLATCRRAAAASAATSLPAAGSGSRSSIRRGRLAAARSEIDPLPELSNSVSPPAEPGVSLMTMKISKSCIRAPNVYSGRGNRARDQAGGQAPDFCGDLVSP